MAWQLPISLLQAVAHHCFLPQWVSTSYRHSATSLQSTSQSINYKPHEQSAQHVKTQSCRTARQHKVQTDMTIGVSCHVNTYNTPHPCGLNIIYTREYITSSHGLQCVSMSQKPPEDMFTTPMKCTPAAPPFNSYVQQSSLTITPAPTMNSSSSK